MKHRELGVTSRSGLVLPDSTWAALKVVARDKGITINELLRGYEKLRRLGFSRRHQINDIVIQHLLKDRDGSRQQAQHPWRPR